jgi:hypothetical protein
MHSIHRLLGNSANSSPSESRYMWSRRRRRSTNHWAGAKLACVLFLVSTISLAQRVVTATANIPFDFWAEGQKFTAGEYTFDTGFPGSTSVHRKGTKTTIAVPVIIYGDPVRKEDAKIVFVLRDGKYYLVEFWCMSDRRVVTAEFDHRGQTVAGQRVVQLTYP